MTYAFLVDVKSRFINNTPSDVFRLLSFLGTPLEQFADLRFETNLPNADHAVLFLETAGTWMCFDWDEQRFARRISELVRRYDSVTVVGPQAAAVRTLLAGGFKAITNLDFETEIAPAFNTAVALDVSWFQSARDALYTGEHVSENGLSLVPTVSVHRTMTCPLTCDFCYYARRARAKYVALDRLLSDIGELYLAGHRHFYFMDPNFILRRDEWRQLADFKCSHPDWTYYCQISPNLLTEEVVDCLARSGCSGMVIGIENDSLIRFKSNVQEAHRAIDRVRAQAMVPMLYFIIDGENDVLATVEQFAGNPFRFSVLNTAFASDLSLAGIQRGFSDKSALRARCSDAIAQLQTLPDYLGARGAGPAIGGSDAA